MEIMILGPLEVVGASGPVAFRSPQLRRLLGALVAWRTRPVTADELVDAVWGVAAPPGAASTIHGYVHRLRALVPDVIHTTPTGYRLQGATIDADRFTALLADAAAARRRSDHEAAISALDAALGLWRGDAYGELAEQEFAEPEAMELDERRRTAVEDRADELLAAGRHVEAIPGLRSALAREPYRDRRCAQLVLALHRAGRRPEALQELAAHRRRLAEDLGVEPSGELRALECGVAQQSPALDWRPCTPHAAALTEHAAVDAVACAWIAPDPETVSIVTGLAPETVLDQLDEAVRAGVLVVDARRRCHLIDAPARAAAVARIPPRRLAELHLAYLQHWSSRVPDLDAVIACAAHAGQAIPLVGAEEAASRALTAGRSCLDHGALHDSVTWFTAAAELFRPCSAPRVEAMVGRATALAWSGNPSWVDAAVAVGRLADEVDDVDCLVAAALVSPSSVATGSVARSDLLHRALARCGADHPHRTVLAGELAAELVHPGEEAERRTITSVTGLDTRTPSGDAELAERLVVRLNATTELLHPTARRALADELEALGHRLGSDDALWLAGAHRFWCAVQLADRPAVDHVLTQVENRRSRARRVTARAFTDHLRALVATMDGELESAEALLRRAAAERPADELGIGRANEDGLMLRIRRDQGRLGELLAYCQGPLSPFPSVFASVTRALILADAGDHDAARRHLARRSLDTSCPGLYRPHLSMLIIEAAEACGAVDLVEPELERLTPLAGLVMCTTRGCDGAVDRALGLGAAAQGRLGDADRWLASGLVLHEQLRAPALVARTLHDRARILGDEAARRRCCELAERHHLDGLPTP